MHYNFHVVLDFAETKGWFVLHAPSPVSRAVFGWQLGGQQREERSAVSATIVSGLTAFDWPLSTVSTRLATGRLALDQMQPH